MRFISLILFITYSINCFAQTKDQFVDPRDGRIYNVELVDSTWWFADNLKYETAGSHCPNISTKHCTEANFYPYTELDEVCPSGWHVSTLKEWQSVVSQRQLMTGVDSLTGEPYGPFIPMLIMTENIICISEIIVT